MTEKADRIQPQTVTSEPIFEGILPVGKASETAVRAELELRRNSFGLSGYAYLGHGDLLLKHGRYWTGRTLPSAYHPLVGAESACFINALQACKNDETLTYCEGVFSVGRRHFGLHAWCIDGADEIVEVTMPTDDPKQFIDAETLTPYTPVDLWSYFGATFATEYVEEHLEKYGLPMLDRPAADKALIGRIGLDLSDGHDFPVLKVPYSPVRSEVL